MKRHRSERPRKESQIRHNARAFVLDKIRAGFICLGLALILFANMGWLAGLWALVGVAACVVIYELITRAYARNQGDSTSSREDNNA